MVLSQRVYVYGVHHDNIEEFLVSELDFHGAMMYCHKHAKLFDGRFSHYVYGTQSQDKSGWLTYRKEDI